MQDMQEILSVPLQSSINTSYTSQQILLEAHF